MHNISIGDIFTDSNEIYRVVGIRYTEEFPNDPFLDVEVFVGGSGFEKEDFGFTLLQVKAFNFQHYKAAK